MDWGTVSAVIGVTVVISGTVCGTVIKLLSDSQVRALSGEFSKQIDTLKAAWNVQLEKLEQCWEERIEKAGNRLETIEKENIRRDILIEHLFKKVDRVVEIVEKH